MSTDSVPDLEARYRAAVRLAEADDHERAARCYAELEQAADDDRLRALIANDLGVLAAASGDRRAARDRFRQAFGFDPDCEPARSNLALLEQVQPTDQAEGRPSTPAQIRDETPIDDRPHPTRPTRVAILSFLFNWPSTGGGIVHTVELAQFLARAGYEVRLIHARHEPWRIGIVDESCPYPVETLDFDEADWTPETVKVRFRLAVDRFEADMVIITDSWNFKPHLAAAVAGRRYLLRMQALECLCPLNNLRLLPRPEGVECCPRHQLATPDTCRECVAAHDHRIGVLHKQERAFSGFGTPAYDRLLRRAIAGADAVLAVNPLIAEMFAPYARAVRTVPSGFDPDRFRAIGDQDVAAATARSRLLFAGLVDEPMKGFRILHAACAQLWSKRRDFELVVTADPPGSVDEFTRFVGWQSQAELPDRLGEADLLVFPTIAQEALGRSAVEAMAAGIPVVASRIGGLSYTVADGATGLLFEPGDADDLAAKIETLLDDPALRSQMGSAGRRRFDEHFSWQAVIDRHYRPLLGRPVRAAT